MQSLPLQIDERERIGMPFVRQVVLTKSLNPLGAVEFREECVGRLRGGINLSEA